MLELLESHTKYEEGFWPLPVVLFCSSLWADCLAECEEEEEEEESGSSFLCLWPSSMPISWVFPRERGVV